MTREVILHSTENRLTLHGESADAPRCVKPHPWRRICGPVETPPLTPPLRGEGNDRYPPRPPLKVGCMLTPLPFEREGNDRYSPLPPRKVNSLLTSLPFEGRGTAAALRVLPEKLAASLLPSPRRGGVGGGVNPQLFSFGSLCSVELLFLRRIWSTWRGPTPIPSKPLPNPPLK